MPSMRVCGSPSISMRFTQAPGSPSSALQTRVTRAGGRVTQEVPFRPAGKSAPGAPTQDYRADIFDDRRFRAPMPSALHKAHIAVVGEVVVDVFGVDDADILAMTRRLCSFHQGWSPMSGTCAPGLPCRAPSEPAVIVLARAPGRTSTKAGTSVGS